MTTRWQSAAGLGLGVALSIGPVCIPAGAVEAAVPSMSNPIDGIRYRAMGEGETAPALIEDFCTHSGEFYFHADRPTREINQPSINVVRKEDGFVALINPGPDTSDDRAAMLLISSFVTSVEPCSGVGGLAPVSGVTVEGLSVEVDASGDVRVEFEKRD